MTREIATRIHEALTSDEAYLGLMGVDYTYGPHLALFRNSMIPRYRVQFAASFIQWGRMTKKMNMNLKP
jgi:hypothetical protein